MKLHEIEQDFFANVLQAELDVPAKAKLKVSDDEFPVMVIPQISQNGYFELSYFGTPAHIPENKNGTIEWDIDHIFGVHPVLENAWDNQYVVELEFEERPQPIAPFPMIVGPKISTRVLVVEQGHKGRLAIHKNQIQKENSTLKRIKFSLVDFPDFKKPGHIFGDILHEGEAGYEAFQNALRTIKDRFREPVEVNINRPLHITLIAGKEWEITLTKDAEQTRDRVSHSGLITRAKDEEFEVNEADDLLVGLNQFFAFVSCAYRHPTAIIGENSHGRAVWGQIGKFKLMPRSINWFNNDSSVPATIYLESLFPRFWAKWRKHPEELTVIVESYVNSKVMRQAGLPKEAIATSYTGLEALANLILKNPKSKGSANTVCEALGYYNIPYIRLNQSETPITSQLANKLSVAKYGPKLINEVRNYVVHPLERDSNTIKQEYLEHLDDDYSPYFYLHDLCQFYLECLFLTGLCDYQPQHLRILTERR